MPENASIIQLSIGSKSSLGIIQGHFSLRGPYKMGTFIVSLSVIFISLLNVTGLRLINKVAIVGSGTAGLGLAAALKQLQSGVTDITVFESRLDFLQSNIGGGVQLSGGAAVLEKMGCLPAVERTAHRMKAVRSRNSYGTELLQLDVLASVNEKAKKELCANDGRGEPMVFSIMRDALQHILHNATQTQFLNSNKGVWSNEDIDVKPLIDSEGAVVHIKAGKKCVGVTENESTGTVCLNFEDGSKEDGYDMVFGADGVGSALRQFTAFKEDTLISPLIEPYFSDMQAKSGLVKADGKRYTGLRITYGITPVDNSFVLRAGGENTFHQWFGSGCYALTASYGGLKGIQHMIAVVYRDDRDSPQGENAAWNGDKNIGFVNTKKDVFNRLEKAGLSSNREIKTLLDACETDRFIDLGVRDTTVPLRGWSSTSGRVVLIGDSAHAMAPFLGQGANQALQDAFTMALEIKDTNRRAGDGGAIENTSVPSAAYLKEKTVALRKLTKSFESKRKLPTGLLSAKSNFLGALETLPGPFGGIARDLFFITVGKLGIAEYIFLDGAKPNPTL